MKHWKTLCTLIIILLATAMPTGSVQAAPRCFPETNQCMDGRIREYWEQNGGLPVFGFPTTAQSTEVSSDTSQGYPTQWMERNRFELHPENNAPYDVLLGRLGDERLRQLGVNWQLLPKTSPSAQHYFAATGQAITHDPFWRYWSNHGLDLGDPGISARESLALFGLPISPLATETNTSGDTVLTQWFERARFEDHGPKGVLLGLLGNEVRVSPRRVRDRAGLEQLAAQHRLFEHISDSQTVRLFHYPSAVTVSGTADRMMYDADLVISNGKSATLTFAPDVHAIGFTYQQGLYYGTIDIELVDGRRFSFQGERFFPEVAFFGFYSPEPLKSLTLSMKNNGGNLYLREFYFYAKSVHPRRFD